MLPNHVAAPSSSPAFSSPTIFRVRRKRTADPHGALVISLKRAKQIPAAAEALIEPIICQRATASDLQACFHSSKFENAYLKDRFPC